MCGIFCEIHYSQANINEDIDILQRIKNRGPDSFHKITIAVDDNIKISFYGSVLWMRGSKITCQPLDKDQGVLLFNGDIFDSTWDLNMNDTELIMNMINQDSDDEIVNKIKTLKGPFSIIYYNKVTKKLYFTRDRLGRNTLLFHGNENSLVISSTLGRKQNCIEIPTSHLQVLDIRSKIIKLYSWEEEGEKCFIIEDWYERIKHQQSLPDENFTFDFKNDCREDGDYNEIIKYIEDISLESNCKFKLMTNILDHMTIKEKMESITELLKASVKIRLQAQPNKCRKCIFNSEKCYHASVGILFSGGLDCTILAYLADEYLPKEQSIDLLNVAFKKSNQDNYEVPDRLTAKQSFLELKSLCPSRNWTLKEINISQEELERCQKEFIADLVHPRQTILDESLGTALWFAAKGQDAYDTSHCRVLLLGSGADELFGGYTRHRNAYKRNGWRGLNKELHLDWRRISFRNLARDNRVICDHGRQPRLPYLDEDFAKFVLDLKPWFKCFPSDRLGPGIGDKLMLRLVAFNLGLTDVATYPKRALQFGSRIANKKERGSDISKSFKSAISL